MDPTGPAVSKTTVVVAVGTHLIGLPTAAVQEMFVLRETARPPGLPPGQRGVVTLRNKVLPVLDLRMILGLADARSEVDAFVELLRAREQDHRDWMDELEASAREQRPFTLATDPRQCQFGKWYSTFHTDNVVLGGQLRRFEDPHARIHALADEAVALQQSGRAAEVPGLLAEARTGLLTELVDLFEATCRVVLQEHREIGVVLQMAGRPFVLAVDRAEAVKQLEAFEGGGDPLADSGLKNELFLGLARFSERDEPVFLLDLARLGRA